MPLVGGTFQEINWPCLRTCSWKFPVYEMPQVYLHVHLYMYMQAASIINNYLVQKVVRPKPVQPGRLLRLWAGKGVCNQWTGLDWTGLD